MSRGTVRRKLLVMNPEGFHLRPLTAFAQSAQTFQGEVTVAKDGGAAVDGKSPLHLMGLAAEKGNELTVEVSGPDAEEALLSLVELLAAHAIVDVPPLPPKG